MKASSQIRRKVAAQQVTTVTKREDTIDPKAKKQNDALSKPRTITKTIPTTKSDIKLRMGPSKATETAKSVSSTVLSRTKPPAKPDIKSKKVVPTKSAIISGPSKVNTNSPAPPRVRTQTRTLKPEEVTVLKHIAPDGAKIPNDQRKAPVSFEVEIKSTTPSDVTSVKTPIKVETNESANITDNEDQYASDFESYESDFECGSTSDASTDQSQTVDSVNECDEEEIRHSTEHKLDSGHYEIKVKTVQAIIESVSCSAALKLDDNQPDSGMNSGQYEGHSTVKLLQNRYTDILNKISLNIMPFELYEEKPASYEHFLLNYVSSSGVLNYTQTESEAISTETQTNEVCNRSCWSQYPPQFSKNTLTSDDYNRSYLEEKHGFGIDDFMDGISKSTENDVFQRLISNLETETKISSDHTQKRSATNPTQLNRFIERSCTLVEMALNKKRKNSSSQSALNSVNLKQNKILQNSVVSSVRCDLGSHHVFVTLHECQMLQQRERSEYSICIWNTRGCTEPHFVLSCWENVTCIEKLGPIVIAGTASGALCLWDLDKTDGRNGVIQIVTPVIRQTKIKHYGGVIAIKTLRQVKSVTDQIITLFETGILITWIISRATAMSNHNLNHILHNAEYCLSQKYCLDLTYFMENQTNPPKEGQILLKSNILCGEMIVNCNNVFVAMNSQLIIVNHLEQKCSAVIKIRDPTTTFIKHPEMAELMIAHSLNNSVQILRVTHNEYDSWQRKKVLTKKPQLGSNTEKSPILSNKSCAIQNIVKNERELYHGRIHGDSQTQSPSTTLNDSNLHTTRSKPNEMGSMHHGQIFFLKHVPPRYRSLFFLDHAKILCVDMGNAVRLIDIKSNGEIKLNELNRYRLLGMTHKQAIMAANDQEILFYDLADHLEVS